MVRLVPVLVLLCSLLVPIFSSSATAQAADCGFVLGFKALHDLISDVVGVCLVEEHHNPDNGDGLQETIGANGIHGLLVWRKADNWTAFTDGFHTWINGPFGLQQRLNTDCFFWESACGTAAGGSSTSTTVTFTSVVGAAPGGTASVTVQTSPNTACSIDYFGPNGADRFEFGTLRTKTSDANGVVSWSWPISRFTPLGSGTVTVHCNGVGASTPIAIGTTPVTVTFSAVTGAAPGGTASVTVKTSPAAFCAIDYFGPNGRDRFEFGALHVKQADSSGNVSWSWLIAPNTPAGNGSVTVNCEGVTATTAIAIS
jgi:hypothetical protein